MFCVLVFTFKFQISAIPHQILSYLRVSLGRLTVKTPTVGAHHAWSWSSRSSDEVEGHHHQNQSTRRNMIVEIEQHPNALLRRVQGNLDFCATWCIRITIRSREVFTCYWPKIRRVYRISPVIVSGQGWLPKFESKKENVKQRLRPGVKYSSSWSP